MVMLLYVDSRFVSPYAMSAFIALAEKRLSFELRTLDMEGGEHKAEEYARKSLTKRIPTLVDGVFTLSESSAIAEYLNDVFPIRAIFPIDVQKRARARQIQAWLRSDLDAIREERSAPTLFYRTTNATPLSPAARQAARKLFTVASELLSHGRNNLFGDWSIADFDLAFMLNRLILNGDAVPSSLVDYATDQWKRPCVQQWIVKKRPPL